MSKQGGNLDYLESLYRQIEDIYEEELINESPTFEALTSRYKAYTYSELIQSIQTMNRNHELEKALTCLTRIEKEFKDVSVVQELSIETREKASKTLLRNLKESRTSFTLEPSISLFTIGKPLEEFTFFKSPGINLMYGLAAYKVYNNHESKRKGFKKSYDYSQIGLKVDFFNGEGESMNQNIRLNYVNTQISCLINRRLGLDLGYAALLNVTLPENKGLFSANLCAELPLDFLSLGLNARVLSDFSNLHQIQYGISLKYIFKMGGTLTNEDYKSINTMIENIDIQ